MIKYEPEAGERITTTAKHMLEMACTFNSQVEATFNSVKLIANPGDKEEKIVEHYHKSLAQRPKKKYADPYEGRRERMISILEGCPPMTVKDKVGWEEMKTSNTDAYGARIVTYGEDWARLMESGMDREEASRLADHDGITGFMYGAAVSILAMVWRDGEELRKWHNLKTQISDEGVKANASGGVLNPALLNVEV